MPEGGDAVAKNATIHVRSPKEIASALIQSMSKRGPSVSTNVFSDRSNSKQIERKLPGAESLAALSAAFTPAALNPTLPTALMQGAEGSMAGNRGGISDAQLKASSAKDRSSAPVAFALKLTPKDDGTSNDAQSGFVAPVQEESGSAQSGADTPESETEGLVPGTSQDAAFPKGRFSIEVAAPNASGGQILHPTAVPEPNTAAPTQRAETITSSHPASAGEALRSAVTQPAPLASAGSSAQEIALRINQAEQALDVHVTERAGQIHVAVRTPDSALQSSLRQDLGTLVKSLDRAGFHAEASAPQGTFAAQSSPSFMNGNSNPDQNPDRGDGRNPGGESSGRQQQHHQPKQNQQDWAEALENA
jgi:hypothetical protein